MRSVEAFCESATHTHTHSEEGWGLTQRGVCCLLSGFVPAHCCCCCHLFAPASMPASLCGTTNKATYTWLKSTVAKKFKIYFVLSKHTQRKKKEVWLIWVQSSGVLPCRVGLLIDLLFAFGLVQIFSCVDWLFDIHGTAWEQKTERVSSREHGASSLNIVVVDACLVD